MMLITKCKTYFASRITTWDLFQIGTMPLWIALLILLLGSGEQWNRAGNRYRDHAAHEKYQVVKIET
jgi:hypothetical protein